MEKIKINIEENLYNLNIEDLFVVGNRINNSKRNFLFISKLLGKHIEIKPEVCKESGKLLTSLLKDKDIDISKDNLCVLGFAETATGLGMAVAANIENSYYLTTTREDITELQSIVKFEEEHSHATTHKCFPIDSSKLINADKIILVDDEITTGKSIINIVNELKSYCKAKEVLVLTILDWREKEHKELYEDFIKKSGINVKVLSLVSGKITSNNNDVYLDNNEDVLEEKAEVVHIDVFKRKNYKTKHNKEDGESYLCHTGRFGVSYDEINEVETYAKEAASIIHEKVGYPNKILVLGHGENIYIPSRIANYLEGDISFKSTTRSPIYCCDNEGYPIRQKNIFYHKDVKYYFYNKSIIEKIYDKVILITEDDLDIKLSDNITIIKI